MRLFDWQGAEVIKRLFFGWTCGNDICVSELNKLNVFAIQSSLQCSEQTKSLKFLYQLAAISGQKYEKYIIFPIKDIICIVTPGFEVFLFTNIADSA